MTTEVLTQPEVIETITPEVDEIVVVVTLEDIANGEQRKSFRCPIALAATRATGQICQMGYGLLVGWPQSTYKMYGSQDAADWAFRFDKDRTNVAPERFVFKRFVM